MLRRVRRFARELHRDESGPNTVEWVLLIIVALIVLVIIYVFVQWVTDRFGQEQKQVENTTIKPPP